MSAPGYIEIGTLTDKFLDITGKTGEGYVVEVVEAGTCSVFGEATFPNDTLHITIGGEVVKTFGFPGKARIVKIDGEWHHLAGGVSQGVL